MGLPRPPWPCARRSGRSGKALLSSADDWCRSGVCGARAAADEEPSAAAAFRRFFAALTVPHFHEEEERLFPLLGDAEEARPRLVEALLDHQRLHALAATLDGPADVRRTIRELGERLEVHVRLEERELDVRR
jgi:hypothetical protein